MTAFLWAQDRDGLIGKDGHLPWHLPDDLHYFRAQTVGKIMVVGRRTYESFPKRPLPERTNVVLTHQEDYQAQGAVVVHDVAAVFAYAKQHPDQELVIAGGAGVSLDAYLRAFKKSSLVQKRRFFVVYFNQLFYR